MKVEASRATSLEVPSPTEPPGVGGMARSLDKLFRTAMVIVPIGVAGNVAVSLLVTDRDILSALASFPRTYLALALVLGIIPWFTNAARLLIWSRFLGHDLGFRESLRIALATDLGAAVSPTAVGGGFFKWGLLVQRGVTPGAAVSLTTLTHIEDGFFFALAVPTAVVLSASWDDPAFLAVAEHFRLNALPILAIGFAVATSSWLAIRWVLGGGLGRRTARRGRVFLGRIQRSLWATWVDARDVYRLIRDEGKTRFAFSVLLTAIQWICRYSIILALFAFLGAPVEPILFWLLQWVVFTLAAFIPTPGGAGAAEAAFFVIYSPFVPAEIIGLATAGWRFFTFYLLLLLAALLHLALARLGRD